jgi:hypothetical protein
MVIAVIGAGTLGLVTLKNLLEEGLDAVGFERSSEGEPLASFLLSPYRLGAERGRQADLTYVGRSLDSRRSLGPADRPERDELASDDPSQLFETTSGDYGLPLSRWYVPIPDPSSHHSQHTL